MLVIVLSNDSNWSRSLIRHPAITFGILFRLRYRVFSNHCVSHGDLCFRLLRRSIVRWRAEISTRCLDFPTYKTRHCWHSTDTHSQDGVTKLSCTVLAEKAASTLYMNYCHKVTLRLPKLKDQKSLRLCWRWFSEWGRERATVVFALKGGRCLIYRCLQPIAT